MKIALLALVLAAGVDDVPHVVEGSVGFGPFRVGMTRPVFAIDGERFGREAASSIEGDLASGEPVRLVFPEAASPLESEVFLQWAKDDGILRKWMRFRVPEGGMERLLEEIVLDTLDLDPEPARTFPGDIQSYPVFIEGGFCGVEFPVAATRVEGKRAVLAHRPGLRLEPGVWHESRRAIYGLADPGEEMRAFQRYIQRHRPGPHGLHVDYNSWWTSPAPYYTEKDILDLMAVFDQKLYREQGGHFDTFCIDMGWSNPKSIWAIDTTLFPEKFTRIQHAAEEMNCRLGLWISPSSRYPTALDPGWAQENGYPMVAGGLCLGGTRYADAFRDRLVEMVTQFGVRHIKWDGYVLECPATDHGHAPGPLSAEAIAEGVIRAAEATHAAAPDTWFEPTCFGWNPSPWWLFHFNSVIGSFGDDAPFGRVPAPVSRESYTTARDYFNLQGAYWSPVPDAAQEVLGVIHQTADSFMNDAVITLMRGHEFLPVYLNPKYMDDARWKRLAQFLAWARAHEAALEETEPILPASWRDGKCPKFANTEPMPREPYGYSHWEDGEGWVALRNPWLEPASVALTLDRDLGVPKTAAGLFATSVYPEARRYARNVGFGDTVDVPLAPYETVVLRFATKAPNDAIPEARTCVGTGTAATDVKIGLKRIEYDGPAEAFGPDWTSLVGDAAAQTVATVDANVTATAPETQLGVLLDGFASAQANAIRVLVDGQPATPDQSDSDTAWGASGLERPEHWRFYMTPLPAGSHRVSVTIAAEEKRAAPWVFLWAAKPGAPSDAPIASELPQPERISLDGEVLLRPEALAGLSPTTERVPRPIERIDGAYLDALEPESVTQGWGTLQRNRSVWEKPLCIEGQSFLRGLGTHAPSRIVYKLDGAYRRFQAWAGADAATGPTVTFEVWVDGGKRWESGLMQRNDAAKCVDIDVSGAKKLELVVGDGGNDLMADHADWADAKLLR